MIRPHGSSADGLPDMSAEERLSPSAAQKRLRNQLGQFATPTQLPHRRQVTIDSVTGQELTESMLNKTRDRAARAAEVCIPAHRTTNASRDEYQAASAAALDIHESMIPGSREVLGRLFRGDIPR